MCVRESEIDGVSGREKERRQKKNPQDTNSLVSFLIGPFLLLISALGIHFQSMGLPTPLAWYSHHLPAWFLRLTTAFSLATELLLPPLFLLPLKGAKKIAFYFQVNVCFQMLGVDSLVIFPKVKEYW